MERAARVELATSSLGSYFALLRKSPAVCGFALREKAFMQFGSSVDFTNLHSISAPNRDWNRD
jgi:hypothetical protein